MTMLSSINEPYERLKSESKPSDITVFSYSSERSSVELLQERFNELEKVEKILIVPYSYIVDDMYVGGEKLDAFANLVTYDADVDGSIRVLEGSTTVVDNDGQKSCLIPACIKMERLII